MGKIDLTINKEGLAHNIKKAKENGIIIPTIAEMQHPETIPEKIQETTIPIYIQFVQVSMMNSICRKIDFPNSILQLLQLVSSFFFPIIECTYHINMCSIRRPFTKSPSFGSTVQSEVKISRCKVRKSLLSFIG